ncbi:uncharacterized protein LOC101737888 isoform X1 [Bombyx mori]|uniref:Uncharacterized protein n=1 Tax=Bombyx mori TaxID=7091 RepID=A0A8R2LWH8_BOMMO|nr:uncharacterized protein LOC101737888 [Bombyx mori]
MLSIRQLIFLLILNYSHRALCAPVAQHSETNDASENKTDLPVEQLEKLKTADSSGDGAGVGSAHVEFHSLDAIKANGELVSRLEQHASADSVNGEKPRVHAQAQLDVPSEGVHRVLENDGSHVSVHDVTSPPTAAADEVTPKVFHGAARLIQPGSATSAPQGHTAARRALNPAPVNQVEHFSPANTAAGVQYTPMEMAEYVFWTGDERGVTTAIEVFLQEGMMTKEEAISFLEEIKFNLDYLRAHYAQNMKAAEENAHQEKLRNMLLEQVKDYQYRVPVVQSSFGGNHARGWELGAGAPLDPVKRAYDPMLQTNIISTSDYDRDGQIITDEEYEEMMDKLKAADTLYTEYTLEEIIYQLAKMMFSQSLSRDPASARAATQRFMAFLELEAERGQLSRTIEKKVLDVMIAALTDTIGDHPELLQAHDSIGVSPGNRLMRQFLETSASEPGMSRAILAAYKDELLRGPPRAPYERN